MKTNKSYSKRLKVTRNGKIVSRGQGQNHFNSKESRRTQLNKRRSVAVVMTQKSKSRYLPGLKVAKTALSAYAVAATPASPSTAK